MVFSSRRDFVMNNEKTCRTSLACYVTTLKEEYGIIDDKIIQRLRKQQQDVILTVLLIYDVRCQTTATTERNRHNINVSKT